MMTLTAEQIVRRVREAGVVGAGGAGFPTYKKLEAQVEHMIANGAECEPLLQKDRETMLQDRAAFLRGLAIMREATGAKVVTIAAKRKNQDVIDGFREEAEAAGFSTLVYEDVYPAGDEYLLVYEITGRQIPPGGIPLAVGAVVDNVETIVNIARAVDGQPVTDKYLTICGEVKQPLTTVVPVGTRIADCIEHLAGGGTTDKPVVLTGGLMMGGVADSLSEPVTKNMGGLIVLPSDHYLVRRKTASRETYTRIGHGQCDQCSLCTELCPRYTLGYPIEPHRVMRTLLMTGDAKQRGSLWAQYCCECNICSLIACPEQLDPKNICVDAKRLLRENRLGRTDAELKTLFRQPHPFRKGREIPIKTLYTRLGLTQYDRKSDFQRFDWQPESVTLPLAAHVGAPAKPVVREGDRVRRGDVIGRVDDHQLGCPVHASIDGRVTAVTQRAIEITAK
ncbi:MAG TPA: 4Fe-4S dicluster domain-containing protein [Candidatus Anammoximicrobium sp.]|nr:4Fe-4S dicluster domain-containing protein [Candidatus Anammoximicrobium sp.]